MPVANVVGQADNLLINGQHAFWNGFQASGTSVGRISSSVQRASNILPLDMAGLAECCAKRGNLGAESIAERLLRNPIAGRCARAAAMNSRHPIPEARMAAGAFHSGVPLTAPSAILPSAR
jgi:hypothetical protein